MLQMSRKNEMDGPPLILCRCNRCSLVDVEEVMLFHLRMCHELELAEYYCTCCEPRFPNADTLAAHAITVAHQRRSTPENGGVHIGPSNEALKTTAHYSIGEYS